MNLTFGLRIAALEPANLLTGRIAKLFMMMEADPLDHIAVAVLCSSEQHHSRNARPIRINGRIQANED